jgi:hypothetical protein
MREGLREREWADMKRSSVGEVTVAHIVVGAVEEHTGSRLR